MKKRVGRSKRAARRTRNREGMAQRVQLTPAMRRIVAVMRLLNAGDQARVADILGDSVYRKGIPARRSRTGRAVPAGAAGRPRRAAVGRRPARAGKARR